MNRAVMCCLAASVWNRRAERLRLVARALGAMSLCITLLGSFLAPSFSQAALIGGVNHTHWAINYFVVEGRFGMDIGPYQLDSGACCYIAPDNWEPGLAVQVDWQTGIGGSDDYPGMADWEKYKAWIAEGESMKRNHSKLVAIPDYTGQRVCGITVHFLPCDELQATTSCEYFGTPEYPIHIPLRLPEPQSCPT